MLLMKDCAIDPGDIVFVVSSSRKPFVRLKQAAQSITTAGNKHGHMEVVTVFVCTGKNEHGIICHNYERQLSASANVFIENLQGKSVEELTVLLLNYCSKEFTSAQIKKALEGGFKWMKLWASQITGNEDAEELIKQFLVASNENKERLIQLLVVFWRASGQAETLPAVNSSLLVFKHTDSNQRRQFLEAYRQQVNVTKRLYAQGKTRTSFWAVLKSLFQWSNKQDKKDREKHSPSEETFCSQNVMQVLNQVNPDLVKRGRHVLPKSLEAGLREATEADAANQDQFDDFEAMIAAQKLPPFKLQILPSSGKELMSTLLAVVDQEIQRIESKWWINQKDRNKAFDLKKLVLPFRDPKYQNYPVELQVDEALKLIATLLPTLQRKTGFLGEWFPSTAYANVRAFARTQGIFDGDIREATEKLNSNPVIQKEDRDDVVDDFKLVPTDQIYIFSDWSFSSWSISKRELMLKHMLELLDAGHALYTWENEKLVQMNKESIQRAINGDDFDDLLASKLKPATRATLLVQAQQQQLATEQIHFLDYKVCQELVDDHQSIETHLNQVAPIFSPKLDRYHLNQTKQAIIDIELENTHNESEQFELQSLKSRIINQKEVKQKTYQSGIDTKAFIAQPKYRKPIFKPVNSLTFTPPAKYYRDEVYSDLVIHENPSSPFQYFELAGMNATDNLVESHYNFHPEGLTEELIEKRKEEPNRVLLKGKKRLNLTENWQALPSLHPGETLLDIAISELKKDDFEIKYSQKNHLHYIRLLKPTIEPRDIIVNLLLRMPKHYRAHPVFSTLAAQPGHHEIHRLLMKYFKFGRDRGELRNSIGATVHNGTEYLNEARKLGVASCRLRAIAFKEEMSRLYPEIPVSVAVNPDHCFIEMELDGQWQRYCLGGYRDTPTLMESVKEDTLRCRFFTESTKQQARTPVEEVRFVNRFG
ncbi:hypothetical protein [Legionella parisiensis]|uniref:Uncharacterized protein n=1 Tax=Legionella parisiensis TaxID=45071 RepID=A0A1E5JPD3_9GAMM|nr:hypothetical protein [Legionella parisiensis]KTD42039.1 hypothetical protein Lpar_3356 [Legionella parisiensis]OEH46406.1 hypothetical protein lpari_02745 [Legionella parisiensis]STX75468.1 Uncharacterised protein [Legionella parisiensis]